MSQTEDPQTKQEFDLQYGSLCEMQRAITDAATKLAGFFLLAIGWIATAESAREFLRRDPNVRLVAIFVVAGVLILSLLALWFSYRQSRAIYNRLVALNYMPAHCFESRVVTRLGLAIFMVGNTLLATLVLAVLLRLDA